MMASTETVVEAEDVMKHAQLVITIHWSKRYLFRLRLAKLLFWLGAYLIGCGIEIEYEDEAK